MRHIYLDCSLGLGGDMYLAALADLGLEVAPLGEIFNRAGVRCRLETPVRLVRGLVGRGLAVEPTSEQPLRTLSLIEPLIDSMELDDDVKERGKSAFRRLAQVEATVHGTDMESVHFHEVGAVDTLVDVLGALWGLKQLGVDRVTASPLPWFRGFVDCAHGRLPLPAPATLALLQGKPVRASGFEVEILTPTGALLIDQTVDAFTDGPEGVILGSGTGFGDHDLGPDGFGLRAVLFETSA